MQGMGGLADTQKRREALARHLGVSPDEIQESSGYLYNFKAFFHGHNAAYLVLTDAEANAAAESAVQEKIWFISLEARFSYFDIDAYPQDVLGKIKVKDIRRINDEMKHLIYHSCGMQALKSKMMRYGNRKNLLADYDQIEYYQDGFFIYRLY
jgi:hypothetical protein